MKLKIVEETILKQRPLPRSQLTPYEQYSSCSGTEFLVDRYICKDLFHGHIKVILHHPLKQRRAWYAYEGHVELLEPQKAVNLLVAKGTGIYLKQSLLPAEQLSKDNRFFLKPGKGLVLAEYSVLNGDHWRMKLKQPINGKNVWYVWRQAVELSLVSMSDASTNKS